ncbi:MAG: hypothetical protein DRQ14_09175 [Candidatus Latescibacterota bacterium]|nr:MAG: hypothetical protein DRQ14_09175 [Candidatus Latescibacterota bacterium]
MCKLILFQLLILIFSQQGEARVYLDEVVVTATRTERAIKELPTTAEVITREEIEASNVNSCTDILSTLPGVFVWKTGAFGRADVYIRGIGQRGRRIMVLVDGRPVKMGLFGCTVTHSLPLNNVERIELIRGPLSVLYGSDALGGVINIITRKARKGFETDATLSYGSYDTKKLRLRHGGSFRKFSYYLTGDLRLSDGHLPNSSYNGKDLTAKVGYEISENLDAQFLFKLFDGRKEEPLEGNPWNDYERGALDLTLSGRWRGWKGFAKIYRNFGEHEFSDGWHSKDFTNGAILHASGKPTEGDTLTAGVEFRQQGGERLSKPGGEWDKSEFALFFHNEYSPVEKLTLTLGTRLNVDEVSGSELCPELGLVLRPRDGTILRGAINKGFRSPQINELYMFPPSNEELEPEVVWNYEAGFSQRIVKGVYLNLTGYLMKGSNLIQLEKNPNPPPKFKFQNAGKFTFKGFEGSLIAQVRGVFARLSYSYLDPGERTQGRPGDKVDLYLRYRWGKLLLSLVGQYVADYFAADNRKKPIDSFLVLNSFLSYEILPGLRISFAVDNVLDEQYEIFVGLPGVAKGLCRMPGRSFTAGVTYTFTTGTMR